MDKIHLIIIGIVLILIVFYINNINDKIYELEKTEPFRQDPDGKNTNTIFKKYSGFIIAASVIGFFVIIVGIFIFIENMRAKKLANKITM
jgi:hypothetical protein